MAPKKQTLEELATAHWSTVRNFARRLCGNAHDAEDIVQQTFCQALGAYDRFEGRASTRTWLLKIAIRVTTRVLQDRSRGHEPFEEQQGGDRGTGPTPADNLVATERTEALHRAINGLSRMHRLVLTLFTVDGLTHAEIAKILDCPEGTVWSRLYHAKRSLERQLDPQLLEE
ncbi:MAG: sigma-70 family RNA polymerase sigma factor [Planctomycetota bacterium]